MPDERELQKVCFIHFTKQRFVSISGSGSIPELCAVEEFRNDFVQKLVVAAQVGHRLVVDVGQVEEVFEPGACSDLDLRKKKTSG